MLSYCVKVCLTDVFIEYAQSFNRPTDIIGEEPASVKITLVYRLSNCSDMLKSCVMVFRAKKGILSTKINKANNLW